MDIAKTAVKLPTLSDESPKNNHINLDDNYFVAPALAPRKLQSLDGIKEDENEVIHIILFYLE